MLYYDLAVFGYQVTCLITMSAVYVCTELEIYRVSQKNSPPTVGAFTTICKLLIVI